ncbi:MAG: HAD family hydrolase [Clostridia bacterium]|nr:HAD family hydrolase [Clostridia bacterium]
MKYPCLVLDHDDTVVNSTATVHYPCFVEYMERYFPHYHCTLEEYFIKNFDPGVVALFRDEIGMTEAQMRHEQEYWNEYVSRHVPQAYEGIREALWRHKRAGGLLCVVSHSYGKNILRDYHMNDLPEPDCVFGWEYAPEQRKPNPYPLLEIMRRYSLASEEMLVLDDLKPGFDMAKAAGVPFAAAGWANDIAEIERFMRGNCDLYFKTVAEFQSFLFEEG